MGQDSCLYLEPFALRYASEHNGEEGDRTKVLAALEYYFGYRQIPDDQVWEHVIAGLVAPRHSCAAAHFWAGLKCSLRE